MITAVISASDYTGSALSTFASVKSATILRDSFIYRLAKQSEVHEFYNMGKSSFVNGLLNMAQKMKQEARIGITIYCGHGNNTPDQSGDEIDHLDELYQFTDGTLLDDEFTDIFHDINENSLLITLSDCCSSGSAIDVMKNKKIKWISIGASTDTEDALQSGDGGVLAETIQYLTDDELLHLPLSELKILLQKKVAESWVGDLQHITMHVSCEQFWNLSFFEIFETKLPNV